jgi:hypothetical protein
MVEIFVRRYQQDTGRDIPEIPAFRCHWILEEKPICRNNTTRLKT